MAARSPSREKRVFFQFSTALSSAFMEWLLILLLLVDAFCLYFVSKIFHSSKLQAPCLLCSRFCYFFGNEKLKFFMDLVCDAHKLKISTLSFCHVHKNLADAGGMCETCLLSFAKNNFSLSACKLLMSKLGVDLEVDGQILKSTPDETVRVPLLENNHAVHSLHNLPCSCCSQPCNIKPHSYRFFQEKSIFKELPHPDIRLPISRRHARAHLPSRLSKATDLPPMILTKYRSRDYGFDHLSHYGYKELKFTSESESEIPFSDDDDDDGDVDDDGSIKVHRTEDVMEESVALKSLSAVSDNTVLEKFIHHDPFISDTNYKGQLYEGGSCDKSLVESTDVLGHGLEEIDWSNVETKSNPPLLCQITSKEVPFEISNVEEIAEVDVSRACSTSNIEFTDSLSVTDISSKPGKVNSGFDDMNLSSFDKGAPEPPTLSEITLVRESPRIIEDLKQCLSQFPAWCLESLWTDFNLSAGKDDESKLSDTSSCNGLQNVVKRPDAEPSCLESADGSLVSEFEGEGVVDSLKRQTEMDRKFMCNLYKELEEERNASAIAANQAMAMINKLQEEKAAMQLEVVQYLRMMEEQTEYEREALQNLNDQLAEREKDINDLEAELESYRKRCLDESLTGKIVQPWYDSDESEYSTTSTPHVMKPRRRGRRHLTSISFQDFAWAASGSVKETVLDFEDERYYISESLKRLEKNVRLFSNADAFQNDEEDVGFNDEIYADVTKREKYQVNYLLEDKRSRHSLCALSTIEENCSSQEIDQMEERNSSVNHPSTPVESLSPETNPTSPTHELESAIEENENYDRLNASTCNNNHLRPGKRNDILALGDEVEHLHERLEALETDRDFLERTINSLRNGKDGLQFVQEIAAHLREIRKFGLTLKGQVYA